MDDESIVSELVGMGWSRTTLAVWLRAKCCCEYCDGDLLASDAEYFYGSHVDHVVPGRGDDLDNLALACKACNFIKGARNFSDSDRVLSRPDIVAKARSFVQARRVDNVRRLERAKELVSILRNRASNT